MNRFQVFEGGNKHKEEIHSWFCLNCTLRKKSSLESLGKGERGIYTQEKSQWQDICTLWPNSIRGTWRTRGRGFQVSLKLKIKSYNVRLLINLQCVSHFSNIVLRYAKYYINRRQFADWLDLVWRIPRHRCIDSLKTVHVRECSAIF